jgi:glycosyltransferase involved in cell wall biosynthesis
MRIFIIPPNDLLRHPIPNRIYHIAKRFAKRHDIYLLSYTKHPLTEGIKRELKAEEISISNEFAVKDLSFYYLLNAPQIYTTIKHVSESKNIDLIIHANILPSLVASKIAKRFRIPNIYDFLDYYPESASAYYAQAKKFIDLGVKLLISQALKKSDFVVTPSYSLKRIVEGLIPCKSIYVIPNGIEVELFKPQDQVLARKAIGLDTGYYLALLQGSLDVWVDITAVMKVISKLRKTLDLRLLIVGFSHAKHYYKFLLRCAERYGIDKYIYTHPAQPYERMPIFINSSDIVFAPYLKLVKNFTTPLKLAEALACGIPVITTDIIEFKLWYKRGIYTYTTYTELEDTLRCLLNKIDEIKESLHNYSSNFRKTYSWDRLVEDYEKLLLLATQSISS